VHKLVIKFIFLFFFIIYWISEGCTEGYTWANSQRRLDNKLICNRLGNGKGIMDYHAWRYGEDIGILGAILCAIFFDSFLSLLLMSIGTAWIGTFIYERVLNYIVYNKLFPQKPDFHILGLVIKDYLWHDFFLLIIGLILVGISICL